MGKTLTAPAVAPASTQSAWVRFRVGGTYDTKPDSAFFDDVSRVPEPDDAVLASPGEEWARWQDLGCPSTVCAEMEDRSRRVQSAVCVRPVERVACPAQAGSRVNPLRPLALADSWQRRQLGAGVVCTVVLAVIGLAMLRSPALIAEHLSIQSLHHAIGHVTESWVNLLSDWRYGGFLALLVVLERVYPARRGEGLFSVGAAQDLVWLAVGPVFIHTLVRAYSLVLDGACDPLLDGVSIDLEPFLGTAGVLALAFVVSDFLNWLSHVVRHRVSALWHFHEVHHSQTSMSPLLDKRVHFVEWMVTPTIVLLPAKFLGLSFETTAVIATATILYSAFLHANIRTNLGPLRYVLVTPQSHRIHHSSRPEHSDTNFGAIFCLWDRLFGLQYHDETAYPPVGVANEAFPLERSARPSALVTTCARQLLHPFGSLLSDLRGVPAGGDRPAGTHVHSLRRRGLP